MIPKRYTTAFLSIVALLLAFALPACLTAACSRGKETVREVSLWREGEGRAVNISLHELVLGATCAQLDPTVDYPDEALRAIALSTESKLLYLCGKCALAAEHSVDFCDSPSDGTEYLSKAEYLALWETSAAEELWERTRAVVSSVMGMAVCYEGEIALALSHEASYLLTEDALAVCGRDFPYLRSVRSYEDKVEDEVRVDADVAAALIKGRYGVEADGIAVTSRLSSGRVGNLSVGDIELSGVEFAALMGLPSADFSVERVGDEYIFRTLGRGNGLGLSRMGAVALAKQGQEAEAIIEAYFSGAYISAVDIDAILSRSQGS